MMERQLMRSGSSSLPALMNKGCLYRMWRLMDLPCISLLYFGNNSDHYLNVSTLHCWHHDFYVSLLHILRTLHSKKVPQSPKRMRQSVMFQCFDTARLQHMILNQLPFQFSCQTCSWTESWLKVTVIFITLDH